MLDLNWSNIKDLPILKKGFDVKDFFPEKNSLIEEIMIGKTGALPVPKEQWSQINDSQVPGMYAKNAFVDSYFTTAIYFLKRVGGLSLVANKTYRETIDISHTSSYRNSQTENLRIENTIEATGTSEFGSLREMLTVSYGIDKMEEYFDENRKTETKEVFYESTPYAREIVFMDLVKIVALYRKDKKNNTKLIAFDDFLVGTYEKAYDSPHENIEY